MSDDKALEKAQAARDAAKAQWDAARQNLRERDAAFRAAEADLTDAADRWAQGSDTSEDSYAEHVHPHEMRRGMCDALRRKAEADCAAAKDEYEAKDRTAKAVHLETLRVKLANYRDLVQPYVDRALAAESELHEAIVAAEALGTELGQLYALAGHLASELGAEPGSIEHGVYAVQCISDALAKQIAGRARHVSKARQLLSGLQFAGQLRAV